MEKWKVTTFVGMFGDRYQAQKTTRNAHAWKHSSITQVSEVWISGDVNFKDTCLDSRHLSENSCSTVKSFLKWGQCFSQSR